MHQGHGYECFRMCAKNYIHQYCGCWHADFVTTKVERATSPLCGRINVRNLTETLLRLNCARDTLTVLNEQMEQACTCPQPCTQFTYDYTTNTEQWPDSIYHYSFYQQYIQSSPYQEKFQGYADLADMYEDDPRGALKKISQLNLIEKNFAQVRILNHQNSYFHFMESPLVTQEAMFGNVGGLMNLWAGITFITIVEILDFLYQLITRPGDESDQ